MPYSGSDDEFVLKVQATTAKLLQAMHQYQSLQLYKDSRGAGLLSDTFTQKSGITKQDINQALNAIKSIHDALSLDNFKGYKALNEITSPGL